MNNMLGRRGWVDDYVINECDNKPPQHVAENIIYERLEYRWSISQSIRNDQMLKVSHCGTENDLPLISFPDAHKVVSTPEVHLGEAASPLRSCWIVDGTRGSGYRYFTERSFDPL